MQTLRQKRHSKLEDTIYRIQEQRDQIIAKLVRVEGRLQAALKAKSRAEKRLAKELSPVPISVAAGELLPDEKPAPAPTFNDPLDDVPPVSDVTEIPVSELPIPDRLDLEIPKWLQRAGPIGNKTPGELKDMEARAEIEAAAALKKATKTKARIDKMKAKASGETRRMPLTGRAALNYLRTGSRTG